nr:uncharacterized protein LOC113820636 [Penaeus vannamei]
MCGVSFPSFLLLAVALSAVASLPQAPTEVRWSEATVEVNLTSADAHPDAHEGIRGTARSILTVTMDTRQYHLTLKPSTLAPCSRSDLVQARSRRFGETHVFAARSQPPMLVPRP